MTWRSSAGRIAVCVILATGAALPAFAQSAQEGVIEQLRAQGYERFTVSRTLLGRVRIVAEDGSRQREIVFNPRSGEILRDYTELSDGAVVPQIVDHDTREDGASGGGERRTPPSQPETGPGEGQDPFGPEGGPGGRTDHTPSPGGDGPRGSGGDGPGGEGQGGDGRGR